MVHYPPRVQVLDVFATRLKNQGKYLFYRTGVLMDTVQSCYEALQKKAKETFCTKDLTRIIQIKIGSATCEYAAGAQEIASEFQKHITASGRNNLLLKKVGCTGYCSREPIVQIQMPNQPLLIYQRMDREKVHRVFTSHIMGGHPIQDYLLDCPDNREKHIALRHASMIDPLRMDEYIYFEGFKALATVLNKNDPQWVIDEISTSHLRGRGGAGFPTGLKWTFARKNEEKERYLVCNADEGDPGAFMDRSMLESDPFSIVEGMIIGGFAIGAQKGFVYVRAEYPLAIERIRHAIQACREYGLLGKNILASGFDFDIEIRLGAGAFVCGEETALIHSIEGKRGQPRVRPPFPTEEGLWGKPTVINNVETLINVPAVILKGGKKFSQIGTAKSGGTKVFALVGQVEHTGLVEVPIGTTLREIIYTRGGGIPKNKKLKAVQTGGPAGGLIAAENIDTPVDYETLSQLGSIMGSGGMIVLDEDDCMIAMAEFFLSFSQDESCGKCTPCREGTKRMLEILQRITRGNGELADLEKLERLGLLVQKTSLCGLGKAAPNPVLSTLKHFREEYIAHVVEKRCPSKKCKALIHYEINPKKCVGCTACAKACPVGCISGKRQHTHVIDQSRCIKCGTCLNVCRFGAVEKL